MKQRHIIGIDEAGRGPLAGPVAVGAALVSPGFDWSLVGTVRDSKKMTSEARTRFFRYMGRLRKDGLLRHSVAFASNSVIDEEGITAAVKIAIAEALRKLQANPLNCSIFLDGLLSAPAKYKRQHTIIGGDDILPLISMAAIAAKVTRDRLMIRAARLYPKYGFESHKGYGTRQHWEALNQFGLCEIHRVTYCKMSQRQ